MSTALIHACASSDTEIVNVLINLGADVNYAGPKKTTQLFKQ